jgi:hypothetical protein
MVARQLAPAFFGCGGQSSRGLRKECLLASQDACQPYYRNLFLSMAASWLSLAHQDEAIDNLFASWNTDEAIKSNGLVVA